jgi:hypothetical protein
VSHFALKDSEIQLTVSRSNDASQLNVFSELDGASRLDPACKEFGSRKFPEQSDLTQELLTAANVNRWRSLFNTKIKIF